MYALHEIFFNPIDQYAAGASNSYFKINTILFCCPLFFKEYLNPQVRINKMVTEYTAN